MKRIIFSAFFIATAFIFSAQAQTPLVRQTFDNGRRDAAEGKFETALGKFRTSLALAASEDAPRRFVARLHFNIGVCLYQLKEQAKAAAEFERATALDPAYEKSFYALGMAQFELENFQAAEHAFRAAIRLNRRNGENWFDLAFVYLAQNDFDAAKTAFQKSVEYKSVASPVGHNNLGVILAISGDIPAAVRQFEAALKQSGGKFAVAEHNLQFCRSLGQSFNQDLTAKLEFGR